MSNCRDPGSLLKHLFPAPPLLKNGPSARSGRPHHHLRTKKKDAPIRSTSGFKLSFLQRVNTFCAFPLRCPFTLSLPFLIEPICPGLNLSTCSLFFPARAAIMARIRTSSHEIPFAFREISLSSRLRIRTRLWTSPLRSISRARSRYCLHFRSISISAPWFAMIIMIKLDESPHSPQLKNQKQNKPRITT